ncbi:MAG TPA: NAD(P)H-dependent oxidoreductase [Polyangiales bacterium]|jgi:chromate reductase|nr:NAD(P)H-dependent oxidoreductase [Polyangiales bacterium]
MSTRNIAVLVGSLRKESFNRKLANTLIELAPNTLKLEIIDISALQHYNQDDEQTPTAEWTAFRDKVRPADGLLFVTPEYNRSVPGVLKNAIDVGSRPYGKSVFAKKPAAVASSSIGPMGAFGANHHLRQSLVFLDVPAMQQPELYIGGIDKLYDGSKLTSDSLRELLKKFMTSFAAWVEQHPAS